MKNTSQRSCFFRPASFVATALLVATSAFAQDRTARVDSIFSFATPETPGCAVGVSQRGRTLVNRAYGLADVERRLPLGQRSAFDIGSTQKQFVAAAVLQLVQDGRLTLADDIRRHLPELPDYGHKVTVDHLLTHTSGVRDWTGMLPLAPEGTDVLRMIVRQRGLNFAPGEEWSYSNSGYVLLKEIVTRASGMPFAEFARRRLFDPLGMTSSAYVADILQGTGERAIGYQKEGNGWKQYMRLGNQRGGGAIISTAGDLLLWNDALASGRLGAFVTGKLQEEARLNNGRKLGYARGLMVDYTPGGLVVSHSGGAAGYSTWMGRVPEHGLSVAVMCNFDPVSATALAARVSDLYLPPVGAATAENGPPPAIAGDALLDVNSKAGLFFNERTGEPMRLAVDRGRFRVADGPGLVRVTNDRYRRWGAALSFMSQDEFELHFSSNDQFELKSKEGQVTRYRRAQPHAPSPADLQALAGRYESDEIGSVFQVAAGANGLEIRLEHAPARVLAFSPVERDVFQLSRMTVRFRRDGSGKVTGFEYSNPVVKGIGFTRLGDRKGATSAPAQVPTAGSAPVPVTKDPAAPPAGPTSAAPRLEALPGEYELAPGRTLAITLEDGRLYGQPPGSEKRALTHVSGTTFSVAGSQMTLTFTLGAEGRATSVVMRQGERERTLPKVR
jgi:CubicO group peptidase (beta-lactamase class C family)